MNLQFFLCEFEIAVSAFLCYDVICEILYGTVGVSQTYEYRKNRSWLRNFVGFFPLKPLGKRPFARIVYIIKHIAFLFACLLFCVYPVIHFGWTIYEPFINSMIDGIFVYAGLSWAWEGFILRGTALVNEEREVMKALVQYKKAVDAYKSAEKEYRAVKYDAHVSQKKRDKIIMRQASAAIDMCQYLVDFYCYVDAPKVQEIDRDEEIQYTEQCVAELSQNPVIKKMCTQEDEDFRNVSYVTICLEPYALQYDKLQEKFESAQEMEQKKHCLDEMITWADEIAERVETVHNNNTAIERDDSDENIEYVSFINKKMDAISARIKESGDQQCMKKLLDIYAKYPAIQK